MKSEQRLMHYFEDSPFAKWIEKKIPKQPFKVLDAPQLHDDFYWNLLDWGNKNILAVGLHSAMYLWNSADWEVSNLFDLSKNETTRDDHITSISWSQNAEYLSVGTSHGLLQIWDVKTQKIVKLYKERTKRIGSISWWSHTLASGGRDHKIYLQDIREKKEYKILSKHNGEVWGLKWSHNEDQLATGGNDNLLCIYNHKFLKTPWSKFNDHEAAVKALAWSTVKHGILVSGGGTEDRWLRFWNTKTNRLENKIKTDSQIWNMAFSRTTNSLITTHGYAENSPVDQNQIIIWSNQTYKKKAVLNGHSKRVLFLTLNKEGDIAVTGSGDETLRFVGSLINFIK